MAVETSLPFTVKGESFTETVPGTGDKDGIIVQIDEGDCPACGYDRTITVYRILPGVGQTKCHACDEILEQF